MQKTVVDFSKPENGFIKVIYRTGDRVFCTLKVRYSELDSYKEIWIPSRDTY